MKKITKVLIPVSIIGLLLALAIVIRANPPESPQRFAPAAQEMVVNAVQLQRRDYHIQLESYGSVQPRTKTTLTAQVSGQIVFVNPNVRDGGFFNKDDVLVSIDPRDYEANVRIAQAVLMDARQTLADASARSEQARDDWSSLGNEGEPPELVLRLPQLEAARAGVISAEATLQKAALELERTRIVAPFAGRVLQQSADIGQIVSPNSEIAVIYATDSVEVRLPIRNRDLEYIDLPELYRDAASADSAVNAQIVSDLIGRTVWDARLVRTEGAIDESARQLHVIAQIDDPYSRSVDGRPQLKIGQYVTAIIAGHTLRNVLVIPNSAIYQGSYVYVVENDVLQRRNIEINWQNDQDAIIKAGLGDGDILVTTPLGQVTSGVRVSTVIDESLSVAEDSGQGKFGSEEGS
ncbi:MAG TPA: efflux RND transporter periplasmic adaptor subunit [Xanthomonadales bacterium]